MTEKEETGWFDAITAFRKIHPVAFMITFGLGFAFTFVIRSQMVLDHKILALFITFFLITVGCFFEVTRINKEKRMKEKIWKIRVTGRKE